MTYPLDKVIRPLNNWGQISLKALQLAEKAFVMGVSICSQKIVSSGSELSGVSNGYDHCLVIRRHGFNPAIFIDILFILKKKKEIEE